MNRAADPLMSLHGVTRSFTLGGNTIHALRGIDLALARGEIAAVTGPSGSGKSTLLNLCGLLDRADRGELLFAGETLADADEARKTQLRRQNIGFVFQSFNLVPVMTAHDNVEYPLYLLGVGAAERARWPGSAHTAPTSSPADSASASRSHAPWSKIRSW
jgi:putative ABC transport system ATP-binding protein